MGKVKIIIREHNGFKEWKECVAHYEKLGKKVPIRQFFGQFQFLFETKKGLISLVQLLDLFDERWFWEIGIFNKKGTIKDTERFPTIESAQDRIWELLL